MSKSLEKFRLEEKVSLAFLRHRGVVEKVMQECDIPREYVYSVIKKLKRRQDKNVNVLISNTLASEILFGRQSRVQRLMDMLELLDSREQGQVSTCCGAGVKTHSAETENWPIPTTYHCRQCHKVCDLDIVDKERVYEIKQSILKQLLEEDAALAGFAEKMGYIGTVPTPPAPVQQAQQNVVIVGNDKILNDAKNMSPMDREALIKSIEQEIWANQQKALSHKPEESKDAK